MLVPQLTIKLFGKRVSSFHFYGTMGYLFGVGLGIFICEALNLSVPVILVLSGVGAGMFFLLAIGARLITGEETIVYYHHEVAILIACSVVLTFMHMPVLPYLDVTILGIATFLAFGRIGCFSVGCCHGKPSKRGVCYGHDHVKAGFAFYYEDISLFPIQLLESAFVFLIIILGTLLLLHHAEAGTVLILYTAVYGAFRFGVEFFRGDAERPYFKGLSEAQWTTLLLISVSVVLCLTGAMPLYPWHLLLSMLLFAVGITTMVRNNTENTLVSPAHIRQLAAVLREPDNSTSFNGHSGSSSGTIDTFQTNLGLKVSKGQLFEQGRLIKHYTVSCKAQNILTQARVEKLATIIRQLQKHSSMFEIQEKKNAVFHILFRE